MFSKSWNSYRFLKFTQNSKLYLCFELKNFSKSFEHDLTFSYLCKTNYIVPCKFQTNIYKPFPIHSLETPKRIKINGTIGGPNFLRLYWEEPAKDQRVRGYTVEVNDGEAEYFVEGNRTSFRVSYLPRGSLVTYTISAFNPSGDGALLKGSKRLANSSGNKSLQSWILNSNLR